MKPKKRTKQMQSSRMVLRNHDHRDILFNTDTENLVYHNAIYLVKTKEYTDTGKSPYSDGEPRPDYPKGQIEADPAHYGIDPNNLGWKWIKCPNKAMYGLNNAGAMTWTDIDRQFNYAPEISHQNRLIDNADDGYMYSIAVNSSSSSEDCGGYITVNGIVWKWFSLSSYYASTPILQYNPTNRFANNGFCQFLNRPGTQTYSALWPYLTLVVVMITCDANLNVVSTVFEKLLSIDGSDLNYDTDTEIIRTNFTFISQTMNGCLIRRDREHRLRTVPQGDIRHILMDYQYIYVDKTGAYQYKYFENDVNMCDFLGNQATYRDDMYGYCQVASRVVWVHRIISHRIATVMGQQRHSYVATFNVGVTDSEGANVTFTQIATYRTEGETFPSGANSDKAELFFADGKFYCFVSSPLIDYWESKLYSSYDGVVWTQIPLPRWLDVPMSKDMGAGCSDSNFKDIVRIAIKPSETQDYDYRLRDLYLQHPVYYKEGQPDPLHDFRVCFTTPYESENHEFSGLVVYFNNQYLAENSECFAYEPSRSGTTWIPEPVGNYDYCAPPGGFDQETPDPDLDYVWYVWNETTQLFEIVDRHLSTYASYVVVMLDELPQTGEAQTLYGIRTGLNNNEIYEYYVWNSQDGEFITVNNLSLYANYALVLVSVLPNSGAANVIYGVPIDHSAFTSNMYIWNPDHINPDETHGDYEDLNTTSYDMTGKRYRTVNVKSLPIQGYVGIIYISEQKYTPQKVTHEDSTFNFYMWDIIHSEYYLVSPLINRAKYNIIEVVELPPFDPSSDYARNVYKIPKEIDESGFDTKDYFRSEAQLKEFLENHFDGNVQYVYTRELLPLVGTLNLYYCVKESPGQYSGKYTVYLWDWMFKEYRKHSEYEYFIADDPSQPKIRFIDVVKDFII